MSNRVGDCFKFLWPFHNVRTLLKLFLKHCKLKTVKNTLYLETIFVKTYHFVAFISQGHTVEAKGQLISECLFGVFNSEFDKSIGAGICCLKRL